MAGLSPSFMSLCMAWYRMRAFSLVVSTRSHVHYIITENGIADLYGKTLKQRAVEMVKIAHPDHQERIEREYFAMINSH